jgi:hypothetical protein
MTQPAAGAVEHTTELALHEKRKLIKSLRRLDMILFLVCAIVGLDTIGQVSGYGAQTFTWVLVLAVVFLFPCALVMAELGSAFAQEGGPDEWRCLFPVARLPPARRKHGRTAKCSNTAKPGSSGSGSRPGRCAPPRAACRRWKRGTGEVSPDHVGLAMPRSPRSMAAPLTRPATRRPRVERPPGGTSGWRGDGALTAWRFGSGIPALGCGLRAAASGLRWLIGHSP